MLLVVVNTPYSIFVHNKCIRLTIVNRLMP